MAKKPKFHTGHLAKGKKGKQWLEEIHMNLYKGEDMVRFHPLFAPTMQHVHIYNYEGKGNLCPKDGWLVVTNNGDIFVHPTRLAEPEEWAYLIAHAMLHLGLQHFVEQGDALRWNVACDRVVACFLQEFKFGKALAQMPMIDSGTKDENKLYQQILQDNLNENLQAYSTAGLWERDMIFEPVRLDWNKKPVDWQALFSEGLQNAVSQAVSDVSGQRRRKSEGADCKKWFMNEFPLLGALAVAFEVIEDPKICYQLHISVAAVDAEAGKIYFNPGAFTRDEEDREAEYRFVMAHELLHVALRHHARRQGRDPFLWNVACDYVINGWLVEMNVGMMPHFGVLYDPDLKGMNAEAIYDQIVKDIRMYRKKPSLQSKLQRRYSTFRGGKGGCDMMDGTNPNWWGMGEGVKLDDFYRRALAQGLHYHENQGRGFIPAGLLEEIMAIGRPAIPWDVELAKWFDLHFPPLEERRSYARPSRRQDSTPDIPRPRYIKQEVDDKTRTFGVILDTSGSMSRDLLAKALGSIASYAIARDVHQVRVVFCDAHPYDQGYMPPEAIAGKVKVVGRGGTVLMPAVRLLEKAPDFPPAAPVLIITDTECDRIHVNQPRDHAFLIPHGKQLPFPHHAPVFHVE